MRERFRFWQVAVVASVAWSCGSADDTSGIPRPDGGLSAAATTSASTATTSLGAGGSTATGGGGTGNDGGSAGAGGMGGNDSTGGVGGGPGGGGGGLPPPDGGMADSAVDAGIAPPPLDGGATAAMLQDIVCRLSGGKPISATTTIVRRNSDMERQTVRDYATTVFAGMGLGAQSQSYGTGVNLYAELLSTTGGSQWIVIGAHYDTVAASPGADDNGSGVAMVFGVAEYVARLTSRSKNVVFVLFDQEEIGLVGSGKFADFIQQRQLSVHSAHCFNQIGWDADQDRTVEIERPPADLFALYQSVHDQGGFEMPVTQAMATGSDHDSFRNRSIPSLNISEEYQGGDTTPYHHKIGDTCDTLDYDYMASTLGLVDAVMANLLR